MQPILLLLIFLRSLFFRCSFHILSILCEIVSFLHNLDKQPFPVCTAFTFLSFRSSSKWYSHLSHSYFLLFFRFAKAGLTSSVSNFVFPRSKSASSSFTILIGFSNIILDHIIGNKSIVIPSIL